MSNFDQGTSAEDPAAYAARMAAMQRAMQQGNLGPAGPGSSGGIDASGIATGSTGPAGPGPSAPAPLSVQSPDAMTRNATTTLSGAANQTGPAGTAGNLGPQAPNPIEATNAMERAAAAGRTGSLGTGAAAPTTAATGGTVAPPTPTQVATSGSTGASAPATVTTGGSLGPVLTPKVNTGAAPITTPQATAPANTAAGVTTPLVQTPPPAGAGAGTSGGGSAGLDGITSQITQQLQQMQAGLGSPGTPTDATAVYLKQSQSILDMLNQEEAQLRADAEKNGTTVDPSTQFTIDKLKQTLDDNLKSTREQLNARGLYDSGIELELENRLQKGSASDRAMVLADRLSKLQDQLQTGLTNIRSQRFSTASQFGLAGANAQTAADSQGRTLANDREQAALQAMLALRGQQSAAQTAANSEAGANSRSAATLDEQRRQYNETFGFDKAKFNEQMAATAAQNAESNAIARAAAAARAAGGAGGGGDVRVTQAVNDLRSTYNNREDAAAAIIQNAAALSGTIGSAGIAALEAAANSLPSKASVSRGDPAGMR